MTTLSRVDPSAEIACTLPPDQFIDRLRALEGVVGDRLISVQRSDAAITVRLRETDPGLEHRLTEWAAAEKVCCAFLGFSIDRSDDALALTVEAPAGSAATLDGIEWIVRAAGTSAA